MDPVVQLLVCDIQNTYCHTLIFINHLTINLKDSRDHNK